MKLVAALTVSSLLLLGACSAAPAGTTGPGATPAGGTPAGGTPAGETQAPANGGEEAVDIVNFAYDPATLDVSVGTTVTWTNMDQVPHTVTFDDGSVDSGNMENGATFEHTFESAGTFDYHCEIHPTMTATVNVTE